MIIQSICVKHFRSIVDEILICDNLTVLVGRNGAGKSSFLRALNLFYDQSAKVEKDDYYNRDTDKDIEIAVTYKNMSPDAKQLFESYMQGDTLTVERVFSWNGSKATNSYHGSSKQNSDFRTILQISAARDQRTEYGKIQEKYGLARWTNQGAAHEAMKKWEEDNQTECVRHRDDGKFFGFTGVGTGYLGRHTRFLFVPAVREASEDAYDGKGALLADLMDLVVRSVIACKKEYIELQEKTQKRYEQILHPDKLTELSNLDSDITKTLQTFVPDASLKLKWQDLSKIDIPMPQADAKLIEDGYETKISHTGHGLQRAFIVTMLQHLALAQSSETVEDGDEQKTGVVKLPDFLLAIEEPELYQHPSRQRHFANILLRLATGKIAGVADTTQIMYATHSPLFVGIDRVNQLRLLRKVSNGDTLPKYTALKKTTLNEVATALWVANGSKGEEYTAQSLQPRLTTIMTPWMNEGFFADVAVLVEGETDRAAILGTALSKGHDFESMGICVIPCLGKNNIDRPAIIFQKLGVPVYAVWDSDKGGDRAKPEDNHELLRIFGKDIEDWPTFVDKECACFEIKLEKTLAAELGNGCYEALLQEEQEKFGIPKKEHAQKNPVVVSNILTAARAKGKTSGTLEAIVDNVLALKEQCNGTGINSA